MSSACVSLLSASVLSEIAFCIVCVGYDLLCASLGCILCSWDSILAVGNSNQPLGLCFSQHNQHNAIYTSGNCVLHNPFLLFFFSTIFQCSCVQCNLFARVLISGNHYCLIYPFFSFLSVSFGFLFIF